MLEDKRAIELSRIFSILFFSLLLFNVLDQSFLQPYRNQAKITLNITLYLSFFFLIHLFIKNRGDFREFINIYLGFLLFVGSYIIGHLYNQNFNQNEKLVLLLLTCVFIITTMKFKWKPAHLVVFGYIANILILFLFFYWIQGDYISSRYKGIFGNSNVFAAFLFSLLYFQVVNMKGRFIIKFFFIIMMIMNLFLIYITTSRTALLSILVIMGSWFVLKYSKQYYSKLFYLVIGGDFIFLGGYVVLSKSELGASINHLFIKYTKKPLFSGREDIWGEVINYGMTSPLLGHKVGIQIKEYLPNLPYNHAHNQYLQIFVESGILGLFFFLILLYLIWKTFMENLDNHYVQWSASFFLGLLVYQNIEISLFFNMMSIGLIQWLIISIGVSLSLNKTQTLPALVNKRSRRSRLSSKL